VAGCSATLRAHAAFLHIIATSRLQIIHRNLNEALKAANITGEGGNTYNRNARAAARSAFESNKQRFFNHLLTAMKCPTLIASIERDLEAGHACVLQIVSTNEALLDRVVCVKFSKLVMVTGCWFISGQEQHPFVRSK
jgi:hypothetical protein